MTVTTTERHGSSTTSSISASRHLETIRLAIGSDRGVSEMLGVSPSQISRWKRGQEPDPENADRLAALALVVEMLTRWLDVEVIEGWLSGPNAHLGGRTPKYVLHRGQLAEAIGAVEALKAGVFG